jgi:holo-[acyl-carrier protein] synthase
MAEGVGIDLIEIERLERALERYPRLAERVFTDRELEHARRHARPGRHLAARFAAKEAAVKALGLTDGLGLRQIEVTEERPPEVRLTGSAAEEAKRRRLILRVSLTHSRDAAAAVAIASADLRSE